MTITARKHALLSGISPRAGQMAGLFILELVVILSWTMLMDTVLKLLSGSWLTLLPVSYAFAVILLSWLESPESGRRENSPLEALGLAEIGLDGSRPSEWQTLRRLALTPPLLLLLCAGIVPVPGTGRTLLQIISGTRIVPLDESMDPRPDDEVFRIRKKALMKVIAYTMVSLMVAAVMTFVPPELARGGVAGRITALHSLPGRERELLADYLEMKAIYPDCLEFRVRLASLYYRNDMQEDLMIELAYIRRRDPEHSILLLERDLTVTMDDLLISHDTTFSDSIDFIAARADTPLETDSVAMDSLLPQSDQDVPAPLPPAVDSIQAAPDTMTVVQEGTPAESPDEPPAEEPDGSSTVAAQEETVPADPLSTEDDEGEAEGASPTFPEPEPLIEEPLSDEETPSQSEEP